MAEAAEGSKAYTLRSIREARSIERLQWIGQLIAWDIGDRNDDELMASRVELRDAWKVRYGELCQMGSERNPD